MATWLWSGASASLTLTSPLPKDDAHVIQSQLFTRCPIGHVGD